MFLHIFKIRCSIVLTFFLIFPWLPLIGIADCRAQSALSSLNEQTPTNFAPLKTALKRFFQYDRFEVSSETTMKATMKGSKVDIMNKNQTIIALPDQFRSEIQYGDNKYLVTSDGKITWIYNYKNNQYAVTSATQFQSSEDSFLVGLSSSFLLEIVRSLPRSQENGNINSGELLQSIVDFFTKNYQDEGFIFTQTNQTIDGIDYGLYHYKSDTENIELTLWVDLNRQTLEKLQVIGGDQEVAVEIMENIIEHHPKPGIVADTFRFIPTQEMKKVDSLSLEP